MVTLYTPCTGFPDLEAKIAWGIARVALECTDDITITPQSGFYQIDFELGDKARFRASYLTLARKVLSTSRMYNFPGVQPRYRESYKTVDKTGMLKPHLLKESVERCFPDLLESPPINPKDSARAFLCGHERSAEVPAFGGQKNGKGLILSMSIHAGKPNFWDAAWRTDNISLCDYCGQLATLGLNYACFTQRLGSGRESMTAVITPVPAKRLTAELVREFFASQAQVATGYLGPLLPTTVVALALLGKLPHLASLFVKSGFLLHTAAFVAGARGSRLQGTTLDDSVPLARFVDASPFNAATVDRLTSGKIAKVATLSWLNLSLISTAPSRRRQAAADFLRAYATETSTGNRVELVSEVTCKYLIEEVAMIDRDVAENAAVRALADTVRYFVRTRNFGYVDSIRNAKKGTTELAETITKMLRDARSKRTEKKSSSDIVATRDSSPSHNFVPLPDEEQVREVIRLSQDKFDDVRLALAMLGLSRARHIEQETQLTEEELQ